MAYVTIAKGKLKKSATATQVESFETETTAGAKRWKQQVKLLRNYLLMQKKSHMAPTNPNN